MATCSNDVPELLVDYESPIWEDFENIEIDSMFDLPENDEQVDDSKVESSTKTNPAAFCKLSIEMQRKACTKIMEDKCFPESSHLLVATLQEACPMNFDSIPVVLCNGDPFKVNIELQNIHGTDYTVQYIKQEILAKKNITNDEAYAMFIVKQSCKTELPDQEKMIDYRKDVVGCDYIELVLKNDNGNNEKKTTDQR